MSATLVQSERQFQAAVVEYAERLGWLVYHTHDSRRSQPGFPDLTMVRGDRLIFAELKAEDGRVKPEQQKWLDALNDVRLSLPLGVDIPIEVYLWRPSLWHEIERWLR